MKVFRGKELLGLFRTIAMSNEFDLRGANSDFLKISFMCVFEKDSKNLNMQIYYKMRTFEG